MNEELVTDFWQKPKIFLYSTAFRLFYG